MIDAVIPRLRVSVLVHYARPESPMTVAKRVGKPRRKGRRG
jgi:hypothetical protein